MPIGVKDFTWRETEGEVTISLPLKGVKASKVDIFTTDQYIKVNFPPYLFETHLLAPVEEEKCSARVGNGLVGFRLVKRDPALWGRLSSPESVDKSVMVEKRAEAVEHTHKRVAEAREEKARRKREEEQFAIKEQMRLESEERERMEREREEEARRELEAWKVREEEIREAARREAADPKSIWKQLPSSGAPPRPRGTIQVHFTHRPFVTPSRESKAQEEEEWLAKMAAARQIKDPKNINEKNPEFLKDKGAEFFKSGNYEAAINAFSEALRLNGNIPQLYSNRAACYLATKEDEKCISDCCRALELFYPVVPSNYASRTKVFARRGAAYANIKQYDLALQDYDAAMKLSPSNTGLREDYETLKQALLSDTSE